MAWETLGLRKNRKRQWTVFSIVMLGHYFHWSRNMCKQARELSDIIDGWRAYDVIIQWQQGVYIQLHVDIYAENFVNPVKAIKASRTFRKHFTDHFLAVSACLQQNFWSFILSFAPGRNFSEFSTTFCSFADISFWILQMHGRNEMRLAIHMYGWLVGLLHPFFCKDFEPKLKAKTDWSSLLFYKLDKKS